MPGSADDPAEIELAQLLELAATLPEDAVDGVPPVDGPQEWG
jgi:hypothetical protein